MNYDALVFQLLEANKTTKKDSKKDVKVDSKKADLDKDGKLSGYEQKRAAAIEKAIAKNKKKK